MTRQIMGLALAWSFSTASLWAIDLSLDSARTQS